MFSPARMALVAAVWRKPGKREYVQVPRLLETFELNDLHGAIRDAST
jgi:hypothetical protein